MLGFYLSNQPWNPRVCAFVRISLIDSSDNDAPAETRCNPPLTSRMKAFNPSDLSLFTKFSAFTLLPKQPTIKFIEFGWITGTPIGSGIISSGDAVF